MRKRVSLWWVVLVSSLCAGLALTDTSSAQQPPAGHPQTDAAAQAAPKADETKKPEGPKPGEEKTFDEVVKDMEVKKGLFTFYYKADENKLLMEILPEQLDKLFLFAGTLEQAVGERGLYASQVGDDFPVVFHRVGKSIEWIEKNTLFTAAAGTPAARYTARSFADAIHGSAKFLSKPHPERKSILVDASELFVSDLPGLANALTQVYQPSSYRFDKNSSRIESLKLSHEMIRQFAEKCVAIIEANPKKLKEHLENSTAYATLLNPVIGYDVASACVKEAVKTDKTLREVVLAQKLLTEKEFDRMTGFFK